MKLQANIESCTKLFNKIQLSKVDDMTQRTHLNFGKLNERRDVESRKVLDGFE